MESLEPPHATGRPLFRPWRKCLLAILAVVSIAIVSSSCSAPRSEGPADSRDRPLIGITSTVKKEMAIAPLDYARAVREAGGVPVILPAIDDDALRAEYVDRLDGLILIGGGDVPPSAYGEKPRETVEPMPEARWNNESKLIDQWLKSGKPLLGVCLGAQMTNVVLGGSLVQDIPSQIGNKVVHGRPPEKKDDKKTAGDKSPESDEASQTDQSGKAAKKKKEKKPPITHSVTIVPESRLHKILGKDRVTVISSHHQAVKRLGRGLRAAAHSDDDLIEAIELPGHRWAIFVQWHPERMGGKHREALFGSLIRACRKQ